MCVDKTINSYLIAAIKRKVSLNEFEQWLYGNDNLLEEYLGKGVYFDLANINYKSKYAFDEVEEILIKLLDFKSYEDFRIRDLLSRLLYSEEDYIEVCREIYDEYCNGYHFLRYIALTYIMFDSDLQLNSPENKQSFLAIRPDLLKESKRILDFLNQRKIEIVGEYEVIDVREEEERFEQRFW